MNTFSVDADVEIVGNFIGYVYQLADPEGFFYIGSTKNIRQRMALHKSCLHKILSQPYLQLGKFKYDEIKCEILEVVHYNEKRELLQREDYYIRLFKSDPFCLNKRISIRQEDTIQQYNTNYNRIRYNTNINKRLNKHQYYENNKDKIIISFEKERNQ